MVRIRREKNRPSPARKHHPQDSPTTTKGSTRNDEDGVASGTAMDDDDDPALTTDVSNFLKRLGRGKERRRPIDAKSTPFVFQPTSQWYCLPPLTSSSSVTTTPDQLHLLFTKAAELHHNDIATFQSSSSTNASTTAEAGFLSKIIHSGTLSDRLSALTLLVQSSPLHNVRALEMLKSMAERGKGKGGREESLKALRCVVDWWVGGGAPGRKLKYFRDQPLLHPDATDEYLLVWYFEDWLKKYFFSVLQILENLSMDPLPYVRTQSLAQIFTLLRDKPEQEQNLLRLLVNKLGDAEKSLCARASHHLLQVLQTHPAMKAVVVREIVALVLKPPPSSSSSSLLALPPPPKAGNKKHVRFAADKKPSGSSNAHAKYYAAVTFNQIVLVPSADKEVAATLLDVYFEMFKEVLGETGGSSDDVEEEAEEEEEEENVKVDKKGRVLDAGKGKGKGKSATEKKGRRRRHVKGAAGFAEVEDSNSKFVSAILTGVNRALPFANISADDDSRINKHIDTLFFITHASTFNISLQALMLIQQIAASLSSSSSKKSTSTSIVDRYYRTLYASLHDPRLGTSSKQAMYLNLFFRSVKADPASSSSLSSEGNETRKKQKKKKKDVEKDGSNDDSLDRTRALIRRFAQTLVSGGSGGATEFVAGGLYLLGELFGSVPGLRTMIVARLPTTTTTTADEEEEEGYDPRKRDPRYARAGASPLWELVPLLHHYHPAVSLHARQLLSSRPLTASPDLSQNTLKHFLDRFVYKNPKKKGGGKEEGEGEGEGDGEGVDGGGGGGGRLGKGGSAMQPAASGVEGVKLVKGEVGRYAMGVVVNDKAFLRRKRGDVPVDQVFFHDYFRRKEERKRRALVVERRVSGDEDEGDEDEEVVGGEGWDEDVDSDVEEAEVWKAMKATMPEFDDADGDELVEGDEEEEEEDSEGGGMSLAEGSDDEDLIFPMDDDSDDDAEGEEAAEWGGIDDNKKRKRGSLETENEGLVRKKKKKKLGSLPTFASYEDYAALIEEGPEDDI